MNCPFCGISLEVIAAICPSCKNQLPESNLLPFYSIVIERDKSLATEKNRTKLHDLAIQEMETRKNLLEEARKRSRRSGPSSIPGRQ